jgi:hypothetical protein
VETGDHCRLLDCNVAWCKLQIKSSCALYYNTVIIVSESTWLMTFWLVKINNMSEIISFWIYSLCLKPSWIFYLLVAWADTIRNHQSDGILKTSVNSQGSLSSAECKAVGVNAECASKSGGFILVDYDSNNDILVLYWILEVPHYARFIHDFEVNIILDSNSN